MAKRYTYIPKKRIKKVVTKGGYEYGAKDVMDGAYVKGMRKKYWGGGKMAKGGEVGVSPEAEQQALSMIGFDWFKMDRPSQISVVNELVEDGLIPKFAKGGGVAEKLVVEFTLGDGKKVKKTFDSKADMDEGITDYMMNHDVDEVKVLEEEEAPAPAKEEKKKADLFKMAKVEKKGTPKGKTKEGVEVEGLEGDIQEYKRLNQQIKMLTADKELISGKIKEVGKEKYLELYEDKRRVPENFNLVSGDEQIMFVVADSYTKVTDEKQAMLENYGEGLVETVTTYKFTDLIEKKLPNGMTIGEVVTQMIMDNEEIPEKDKMNLITAEVVTRVPKGTIKRLLDYDDPSQVYNLIQPIVSLR